MGVVRTRLGLTHGYPEAYKGIESARLRPHLLHCEYEGVSRLNRGRKHSQTIKDSE